MKSLTRIPTIIILTLVLLLSFGGIFAFAKQGSSGRSENRIRFEIKNEEENEFIDEIRIRNSNLPMTSLISIIENFLNSLKQILQTN